MHAPGANIWDVGCGDGCGTSGFGASDESGQFLSSRPKHAEPDSDGQEVQNSRVLSSGREDQGPCSTSISISGNVVLCKSFVLRLNTASISMLSHHQCNKSLPVWNFASLFSLQVRSFELLSLPPLETTTWRSLYWSAILQLN